jgi:hypothetical protein
LRTIVDRPLVDNTNLAVAEVFQSAGEAAADSFRRDGVTAESYPRIDTAEGEVWIGQAEEVEFHPIAEGFPPG